MTIAILPSLLTSLESKKITSTRIRHRAGPWMKMRWSPFIKGLWKARMPANHARCTITGADEMKLMRWEWRKRWNGTCGRGNKRKPTKTLSKLRFVHPKTQMERSRREFGTPAVGGWRLPVCATAVAWLVKTLPSNSAAWIRFSMGVRNFNFYPGIICVLSLAVTLTLCWPHIQGGPSLSV